MRSPFEIFRKHQKELMVVTIGLAMFAFIILDSLTQLQKVPRELMVLLLALVMGFVFWVYGTQNAKKTGKRNQNTYAGYGLLLGAAIGILWITLTRPAAAVQTTAGNISEKELNEMIAERQKALQFMQRAFTSSVGEEPQYRPPEQLAGILRFARSPQQMEQFIRRFDGENYEAYRISRQNWLSNYSEALFGNSYEEGMSRESVVEKYLLLQEAKKLGIQVNDVTVNEFLDRVTDKKLSKSAYLRIRSDLGISIAELNSILRDELKATIARKLLTPRGFRTPEQFWNQYRKLHVKQHIETAAIPAREFLDKVPAPEAGELEKFFEKYKTNYPQPFPSATPAFAENQQAKVAYLEADHAVAEMFVLKKQENQYLTDEEIKAELKKIDEGIADLEKRIKEGTVEEKNVEKEREDVRRRYLRRLLESGGKIKRFDFEVVKYYEDNKATEYPNRQWAARFQGDAKDDGSAKDDGDATLGPRKPAEAKKPRSSGESTKAPAHPNLPKTKATKSPKGKTGGLNKNQGVSGVAAFEPADVDLPLSAVALLQPKSSAPKSAAKKTATKKAAEKKPAAKKAGKIKVVQPPPPYMPQDAPARPFLLLTDQLKMEIRDKLLEERTQEEIKKRLDAAAKYMGSLARQYEASLENEGPSFDPEEIASDLKAYADEHGLKYNETEMLTEIEFTREESSPVPFANEFVINIGGPTNHPRVASRLYSDKPAKTEIDKKLYRVLRTPKHVFWKTGHRNRRIPKFTDTGVKQRVEEAWRRVEAAESAEKRAKELAEQVRESGLPIDRALTGTTVTGSDKSHVIRFDSTKTSQLKTDPRSPRDTRFSWLIDEIPSTAPNQPAQKIPLTPSSIPGLQDEKIGYDFMKTIFEDLGDGDVGVAYNQDKSTYFVVRVFDRTPGGPEGRKSHMGRFLQQNLFVNTEQSVYQLIPPAPQRGEDLLREQLWDKYKVSFLKSRSDEDSEN